MQEIDKNGDNNLIADAISDISKAFIHISDNDYNVELEGLKVAEKQRNQEYELAKLQISEESKELGFRRIIIGLSTFSLLLVIVISLIFAFRGNQIATDILYKLMIFIIGVTTGSHYPDIFKKKNISEDEE